MNADYFLVGTIGIAAFGLLLIGLRGVFTRKPFVVFDWWQLVPVLPLVPWSVLKTLAIGAVWSWVALALCWVPVAIMFWFRSLGYRVYGATDASLREGLLASLAKLNLPYEETSAGLRLFTIGADLQVKARPVSWGNGGVNMKQPHFRRVLRDIAKAMDEYYQSTPAVEVNMKNFILLLLIGGFFALWAWLAFPRVL